MLPVTEAHGRHALEAFHCSPGSEAHIALVTTPPPKCFLTDQLDSQPSSPDRLPQTTSQRIPLENVANRQPSPCLAAHYPTNTSCMSHLESLAPVPLDHRLQFLMLLPMSRPEFQTCSPHGTCPSQTHNWTTSQ